MHLNKKTYTYNQQEYLSDNEMSGIVTSHKVIFGRWNTM